MENYRGLELLHEAMCLRHKTWQVLVDQTGPRDPKSLFSEIMAIREVYIPAPVSMPMLIE
jgi:hypothetical protein